MAVNLTGEELHGCSKEMLLETVEPLCISAVEVLANLLTLIVVEYLDNEPSESQIKIFLEKAKQFRELFEGCNLFNDGDGKQLKLLSLKTLKEIEESIKIIYLTQPTL